MPQVSPFSPGTPYFVQPPPVCAKAAKPPEKKTDAVRAEGGAAQQCSDLPGSCAHPVGGSRLLGRQGLVGKHAAVAGPVAVQGPVASHHYVLVESRKELEALAQRPHVDSICFVGAWDNSDLAIIPAHVKRLKLRIDGDYGWAITNAGLNRFLSKTTHLVELDISENRGFSNSAFANVALPHLRRLNVSGTGVGDATLCPRPEGRKVVPAKRLNVDALEMLNVSRSAVSAGACEILRTTFELRGAEFSDNMRSHRQLSYDAEQQFKKVSLMAQSCLRFNKRKDPCAAEKEFNTINRRAVLDALGKALELSQVCVDASPPEIELLFVRLQLLSAAGDLYRELGNYALAGQCHQDAGRVAGQVQQYAQGDGPSTCQHGSEKRERLLKSCMAEGDLHQELGRLEAAMLCYERGLDFAGLSNHFKYYPPSSPLHQQLLLRLGEVQAILGNLDGAQETFQIVTGGLDWDNPVRGLLDLVAKLREMRAKAQEYVDLEGDV
jgi:tetratricopeptide (TPR) repeat protein